MKCIRMLTFLPLEQIDEMDAWQGEQLNRAKEILAFELTKMVHGEQAACSAQATAKSLFSGAAEAENMPATTLKAGELPQQGLSILDALSLIHIFQDIMNITRRRCPGMEFVLCPVNVQGAEAAPGIVHAIQVLGARDDIDVIIVARGGGSREDLWVFNDEAIARAAYACRVPLVSAIGHEIDFCILDFVADLRAPTPSAAAELVAPDMWGCLLYTSRCV